VSNPLPSYVVSSVPSIRTCCNFRHSIPTYGAFRTTSELKLRSCGRPAPTRPALRTPCGEVPRALHCGRLAEKFRAPCTSVARLDPRAARLDPSCGADALLRNSERPARQQPDSTRARPAFTAAVFPSPTSCWLSSWCSNVPALRCLLDRWLDDFSIIRTPY
jgi:hypothetical protein